MEMATIRLDNKNQLITPQSKGRISSPILTVGLPRTGVGDNNDTETIMALGKTERADVSTESFHPRPRRLPLHQVDIMG